LTHSILLVLVLFLTFFGLSLEKSARHFKTEKHLTFFMPMLLRAAVSASCWAMLSSLDSS